MFEIISKTTDMLKRLIIAIIVSTTAFTVMAQPTSNAPTTKKVDNIKDTIAAEPNAKKDTAYKTITQLNKVNIASMPESKHQITVYGGFGLSTLKFNPSFGQYKSGTDFNIGADYLYYFKPNWGVSTGLNYSRYNSRFKANTNTLWSAIDSQDETFGLMAAWNGWVEQHKISTIGIPIMGRYRYPINAKVTALAGLGLKFAFATSSYIAPTSGNVTLKGDYPRLGVVFENIPLQGFEKQQYRDKAEFKTSFNLSALAEIGASYQVNLAWSIIGACFLDMGFTNLAKPANQPIINYTSTTNTPNYNASTNSNTISKESTLAIGAKIGVIYDFGGSKILRKAKADNAARQAAADEALRIAKLAQEKAIAQAKLLAAQLRQHEVEDSLNNAARIKQQKQTADSLELVRQKSLQDSISALKSKGEGKMIVDIRTDKLAPWEREMLMLPVEFKLGSATMTPESNENAEKIGAMLARHPDLKINITGHTCDLGPDDANYRLGLRRSNALESAFEKAGEPKSKMTAISKGEREPAVPNTSNTNRQKNRRVVVIIEDEAINGLTN